MLLAMTPDISYFILDFNPHHHADGVHMLAETVDALHRNRSTEICSDIYMINQGGKPEHHAWHANFRQRKGYHLIDLETNVGISRAVNLAAKICRAPVMALVTSDALFTKGLDIDALTKLASPEIFQVSPYSQASDAGHQVYVPPETFGADQVTLDPEDLKNCHSCLACELTIRFYKMTLFDRIGYMDERWRAGFEARDFSLRALMAGLHTVVSHGSFCWHYSHGCYKTGAIKDAYVGYIDAAKNGGGSPQTRRLWEAKWPGIDSQIDFVNGNFEAGLAPHIVDRYQNNIHLPYQQNVGY
jgi:GT2 family glycosyltransferase